MAENKDFEAIMKEITDGLSGESEADMKYLHEQEEKYKDHEYGKEILRACGRLIYELIPDDKKEEINKAIQKDNMGFNASLEEIRFNIYKKNYDKALKLIEGMVRKYEEMDMFANDAISEYFCFREPMEEILYHEYNEPKKDSRRAPVDFAELYLQYGILLFDMKRIDDAAAALEKAKRWNPVNAKIAFEYAETFKVRGMIEDFANSTKDIFKYAYRPEDLARCYRNMAYYFIEIKEYRVAVCCLLYSGRFQKSEMVLSELYYISRMTGEMYQPTDEELNELFEKHDIPTGPAVEMLKIAYTYGRHFREQGDDASTAYYFEIFAGFIKDEEVNKTLEEINSKIDRDE